MAADGSTGRVGLRGQGKHLRCPSRIPLPLRGGRGGLGGGEIWQQMAAQAGWGSGGRTYTAPLVSTCPSPPSLTLTASCLCAAPSLPCRLRTSASASWAAWASPLSCCLTSPSSARAERQSACSRSRSSCGGGTEEGEEGACVRGRRQSACSLASITPISHAGLCAETKRTRTQPADQASRRDVYSRAQAASLVAPG